MSIRALYKLIELLIESPVSIKTSNLLNSNGFYFWQQSIMFKWIHSVESGCLPFIFMLKYWCRLLLLWHFIFVNVIFHILAGLKMSVKYTRLATEDSESSHGIDFSSYYTYGNTEMASQNFKNFKSIFSYSSQDGTEHGGVSVTVGELVLSQPSYMYSYSVISITFYTSSLEKGDKIQDTCKCNSVTIVWMAARSNLCVYCPQYVLNCVWKFLFHCC